MPHGLSNRRTSHPTGARAGWIARTTASIGALVLLGTLMAWLAPTASAIDFSKCDRTVVIGQSREGRNITACERGDVSAPSLLVIGQMHGNETAGYWTALRLMTMSTLPRGTHFWIIPTMNPDGFVHNRRQNARGVDLNRNFPKGWKSRGGAYSSGPRPASEPETRAVMAFVTKYQPHTTIVIHQPLYLVDSAVGADPAVTRFVARGMNFPIRGLKGATLPGTFTQWSNANVSFGSAITFEFGRTVSTASQARLVSTLRGLAIWRATSKYSTRMVTSTSVTTTTDGTLVTINGRLQWKNYQGAWVPLPSRAVVIEAAPTASAPFVFLRSTQSSAGTGMFRTYTHPQADECVRARFTGRDYLGAYAGPVTCVALAN